MNKQLMAQVVELYWPDALKPAGTVAFLRELHEHDSFRVVDGPDTIPDATFEALADPQLAEDIYPGTKGVCVICASVDDPKPGRQGYCIVDHPFVSKEQGDEFYKAVVVWCERHEIIQKEAA